MAANNQVFTDGKPPQLKAAVANGWKKENNNLIQSTGIALNTGDNLQTTKAVTNYSQAANFFKGTGNRTEHFLTSLNGLDAPHVLFDGMGIFFLPQFGNFSSNVTVQVGKLDPVEIKQVDGSPIEAGDLVAGHLVHLIYIKDGDYFALSNPDFRGELFGFAELTNPQTSGGLIKYDFQNSRNPLQWDLAFPNPPGPLSKTLSVPFSGLYYVNMQTSFTIEENNQHPSAIPELRAEIRIDKQPGAGILAYSQWKMRFRDGSPPYEDYFYSQCLWCQGLGNLRAGETISGFLEELSPTGDIITIGSTNRPTTMYVKLIRRFD